MWKTEIDSNEDFSGSILLAGLPGIGNVGKIVVDFIIEELDAKKAGEFFSYHMPNSVFVGEDNLVEMAKIEIYFKQVNGTKLLIITGDSQPIDEVGTYGFCDAVLDFFQASEGQEIITFGGIGLQSVPKTPKVYCTGNNKEIVERYIKDTTMKAKVHGVVGPIIGVSGLLLGLAKRRNINAVCLLSETLGHPMYWGLTSSREILKVLNQKLPLDIKLKNLEKEIKEIESKAKVVDELKAKKKVDGDVNYIG
jgi:uncharacterized protein